MTYCQMDIFMAL